METLEGGKLVTRHWVSWNKEDGEEVISVVMIMKCLLFLAMMAGFGGLSPYAGYNALGSLE